MIVPFPFIQSNHATSKHPKMSVSYSATVTAQSATGLLNLGPLTTTFTPPSPSCGPLDLGLFRVHGSPRVGATECYVSKVLRRPDWLTCLPSAEAMSAWILPYSTSTYFSPGIYCPSGWTTAGAVAVSEPVTSASLFSRAFYLTGTHVFCCPSYGCLSQRRFFD